MELGDREKATLLRSRVQEALYEEDMGTKVVATACIAQLFREGDSLGELQSHPTLLQVPPRLPAPAGCSVLLL